TFGLVIGGLGFVKVNFQNNQGDFTGYSLRDKRGQSSKHKGVAFFHAIKKLNDNLWAREQMLKKDGGTPHVGPSKDTIKERKQMEIGDGEDECQEMIPGTLGPASQEEG
ncbi:hypothetical protein ACJX0J_012683, partial [Zea mays]